MANRVAGDNLRVDTTLRPQAGISDTYVRPSRGSPLVDALQSVVPEIRHLAHSEADKNYKLREAMILDEADKADIKTYDEFVSKHQNNMDAMIAFKVNKAFGTKLGNEWGAYINNAYQNTNLFEDGDTNPEKVVGFIKEQQQKFLKERGLNQNMMDSAGFFGGFSNEADKFSYNITQQHFAKANAELDDRINEAQATELFTALKNYDGTTESRGALAEQLTRVTDQYSKLKIGGRKAKENMVKLLFEQAKDRQDSEFLDIAKEIQVGSSKDGKRVTLDQDPMFAEAYKVKDWIIEQKAQNDWRLHQKSVLEKQQQTDAFENALWESKGDPEAFNKLQQDPNFFRLDSFEKAKIHMAITNATEQYDIDRLTRAGEDREALVRRLRGMSPEAMTKYTMSLYSQGYSRAAIGTIRGIWNDVNDPVDNKGEVRIGQLRMMGVDQINNLGYMIKDINPRTVGEIRQTFDVESFNLQYGLTDLRKYEGIVGKENVNKRLKDLPANLQRDVILHAGVWSAGQHGVSYSTPLGGSVSYKDPTPKPAPGEERTTYSGTRVIEKGQVKR